MVNYLEKLQNEYLEEKLSIEKELGNLQIHRKENIEFIRLLEESSDPNFESFSPREANGKNKAKILELKESQKEIEKQIDEVREKYTVCLEKLDELSNVITIAKKSMLLEKENEENELYRLTLLETQENERQRISRELHDSTVQNLTSLVHKTELCSKLVEMDPIRCKLELNMMSRTLREIINETREMIYNLRPMSFDDIGLDVTIERALDKLESSESKKISFSVEGEPYQIKPVIGITLLRIIQEACSNSIKYADASLIQVILRYEPDEIYVSIEDNGTGFDMENNDTGMRQDNSGFGLSMMKERVYLLSGNININSKINHGTKIVVKVPIINKEEK
ncbi:MAG: histidine kinase [Roseburia sp.]